MKKMHNAMSQLLEKMIMRFVTIFVGENATKLKEVSPMIKYFCDGIDEAHVEIGLLESMRESEDLYNILLNFGLEVQAAHLLMVFKASQLIESLSDQPLRPSEIRRIDEVLLKYSMVDMETYERFRDYMATEGID